jgi:arylsulfatase A-like enzyme
VAPDAARTHHAGRPLRPLAAGPRLRALLRLPGRRNHQWYPELTYDNHEVQQPKQPEEGYHLSIDLADKAIEFIQDSQVNAPDKPFFLYYATGAGHAPHHVPQEWADKYKGKFDMGWDKYREIVHQRQLDMGIIPPGTELSAHDPDVPVWDTLSGR